MSFIDRIGYHARKRYVQRVWGMKLEEEELSQYISAKINDIDVGIHELVDESFLVFRKLHLEGSYVDMRSYYCHKDSGLLIVISDETKSVVTMFEPKLPDLPVALRTREVWTSIAEQIGKQSIELEGMYEKISTDSAELQAEKDRLQERMLEIDKRLSVTWKPYEAAERKVIESGMFLIMPPKGDVKHEDQVKIS